MTTSLAPLSCSYTSEVPDILRQLKCSLILSTYQAGKILLLSPAEDGIVQLARNFEAPMGVAVKAAASERHRRPARWPRWTPGVLASVPASGASDSRAT